MPEIFVNVKIIVAILKFIVLYRIKFIAGKIIYSGKNYSACGTFIASTIDSTSKFNVSLGTVKLKIVEF